MIPNKRTIRDVFSHKNIEKIGEYITIKEDDEHCASFRFNSHNNSISIQHLYKCGITTGTKLLQLFDKLAEKIPKIKHIQLTDASSIEICDQEIQLWLIKILTNGQSWYNSHGYFSSDHESDKSHNKEMINMEYKKFRDIVYAQDLELFKQKNSIDYYQEVLVNVSRIFNDLDLQKKII